MSKGLAIGMDRLEGGGREGEEETSEREGKKLESEMKRGGREGRKEEGEREGKGRREREGGMKERRYLFTPTAVG